ncbi:MAG TPA: response regulator [Elusimicrobiota bacterium]|nr:response regulator [Elusimicrobiota bacterium]
MSAYRNVILLVEDSPADEELIRIALDENRISNRVDVARDGQEALDYLFGTGEHAGRDASQLPMVMLLDLHLPKVEGLEVLRRVRENERTRLLPVVILTSSNEQKDRVAGYGLGCNSYVRKPIEFGEFSEAVKQLGLYWLVLNLPAIG